MKKILLIYALFLFCIFYISSQTITIMAANTTSGNKQKYEEPGIRIFKALKPSICAIQEFNYQGKIEDFVYETFGTDYSFYKEPYNQSGDIPNGVIFHRDFLLLDSGSWDSSQINNRGFAYVLLDLPQSKQNLLVVSVHFSTRKEKSVVEAGEVMDYILKYYQVKDATQIKDYVVVAGDLNASSRRSKTVTVMTDEPGELKDNHVPVDRNNESGTNSSRSKDHDFVLPNGLLNDCHIETIIGTKKFPQGIVFDSRVYQPLSAVPPVQFKDSSAVNMQHMAVIKTFKIVSQK